MSDARANGKSAWLGVAGFVARMIVGGGFLYLGGNKAAHPVEFLKLVRQYDMVHDHVLLDSIAAVLPWFEIFCGLLLVAGVAVRGAALVCIAMLVPFTWMVYRRAVALKVAGGIPFCAVKFDCGCGTGEEFICTKLLQNGVLIALALMLVAGWGRRWSLRYGLFRG